MRATINLGINYRRLPSKSVSFGCGKVQSTKEPFQFEREREGGSDIGFRLASDHIFRSSMLAYPLKQAEMCHGFSSF